MAPRSDPSGTSDDSGHASTTFVGLGWPLSMTLCGAVIVFWALGNLLVWWTRKRIVRSVSSAPEGDNDHELHITQETPLLQELFPRSQKRVLLKKSHLSPRAKVGNLIWERISDGAGVQSTRSTPKLPVLLKYSSMHLGRARNSEYWTEMVNMKRGHKRHGTSTRCVEDLTRTRHGSSQKLPVRRGISTDPGPYRIMTCSNDLVPLANQGPHQAPQHDIHLQPEGQHSKTSTSTIPYVVLKSIPNLYNPVRRQRLDGPPGSLGLPLEVLNPYQNSGAPTPGVQGSSNRAPTVDLLNSTEAMRLTGLRPKPPQVFERNILPSAREETVPSLAGTGSYVGGQWQHPQIVSRGRHMDSSSNPKKAGVPLEPNHQPQPERPISEDQLTNLIPVSGSFNLEAPTNPMLHRMTVAPTLLGHNLASQQYQRQQIICSPRSSTYSSSGSAIEYGRRPFGMLALLEQRIHTLLEPPKLLTWKPQARVDVQDTRRETSQQVGMPWGPRPLPRAIVHPS